MEPAPTWLDCLQTLAATETVRLEAIGGEALDELLARGLIQKDERPKQVSLESRYEALQETHRHILEARGCAERLHRRMAPRSRFAGLLGVGVPPPPGPDDPDVVRLLDLLELLKIQVRGVKDLDQIPAHLDRIQEYIQVEGRECLDRLADTDREIDTIQKQAPPGTHVEPGGFYTLTPAGEAALPEAPVMEAFEAALQTAFGPLTHRSASSSHFREDPASLLSHLLEGMARGGRPSALVSEYEHLLEAYDRVSVFSELRSLRAKIAFLVRLLRASRDEPKRAYLWCNRERLNALVARMRPLVPSSVAASGWHLPYAADLFLADGGLAGDEGQAEGRTHLFEAVHRVQAELLMDTRIADGQFVRLVLTLTHAARIRNFTPGILMERFVRQAYETVLEAAMEAPYQLGDRGTRLLFGAHLAHAAGFAKPHLKAALEAFKVLHERLQGDGHGSTLPVQTQLHAFATLDRLTRLGAPLPLEAYAGLLARLRKRLRHHKVVARAFRTEQAQAEDEAALIANLAARVCFQGLAIPDGARRHPDAGMAGLYELKEAGLPPLLGSPFGTLMLS
ncbi:MAG: hypothetical protein HXX12_06520 [Geothrix sp.]|uniref:hypothetical protein n=1 Tax=Geothrix sp. TaxID=1962974 RepID=UPI00185C9A67|nr:hypothetical protein [Geothrix sp.]NWJ40609.1 hypothetical protein [Geothrix sp.]WIL21387.1 MAG: hypothetical protein QOZ81_000646 [Geothrix sp.]